MKRDKVLGLLSAHEEALRAMGVKSLALFGSTARNEGGAKSDIDLLVEFDRPVGYFHFLDVREFVEKTLNVRKVDLVMRDCVVEELKEDIYGEAIEVL